ncbi:MAG TPA: hypothetical protein VK934_10270 [Fimbriimonas sp.]|nr:hypothetical protein [Fimbriimonas sp.]
MRLNDLLNHCDDFERCFLTAPGAVLNVQLAKLMCVFAGLALAKLFPTMMSIDVGWYLLGVAVAGIFPVAHALNVLRAKLQRDFGEHATSP